MRLRRSVGPDFTLAATLAGPGVTAKCPTPSWGWTSAAETTGAYSSGEANSDTTGRSATLFSELKPTSMGLRITTTLVPYSFRVPEKPPRSLVGGTPSSHAHWFVSFERPKDPLAQGATHY